MTGISTPRRERVTRGRGSHSTRLHVAPARREVVLKKPQDARVPKLLKYAVAVHPREEDGSVETCERRLGVSSRSIAVAVGRQLTNDTVQHVGLRDRIYPLPPSTAALSSVGVPPSPSAVIGSRTTNER
jgi:hypothetical protein